MFLLSHWFCLLPGILLVLGYIAFIKPNESTKKDSNEVDPNKYIKDGSIEALDKEFASGKINEKEYLRKKSLLRK